eukprot:TRINITY_DN14724_c1_g1_i1.p1 TRINITY_DN14724_c1_g1~~TRINITY_DN14724_c1_g1_i1.p1  ORF type:complete len:458 (-),score=150.88 TRINITY_DN14724_c1_g1_i1:102-1475(-)
MDDEYDCIILGTGLKECILSGLLSVDGKKVLHMDRNDYYGAACASLNLNQLYEKFKPKGEKQRDGLGASRDYNIDIVPKLIIASGDLVKMLIHTDVTRYLDFKLVEGSYVQSADVVSKVPTTPGEAMRSSLMGLFEKNRARQFFGFLVSYDEKNPKTHQGLNLKVDTMRKVFHHFGLKPDTIDFVGHALMLYREDSYLDRPAMESISRLELYNQSLSRYQGAKSPYIYPLYGLGELPQAFARLSAIWGGTYMLHKPIDGIVYNESGQVCGVRSEGEVAKCKFVIGDPSYFDHKVKRTGQVIRAFCILSHPIPKTDNTEACQLVIPQRQCKPKRKFDIYISCVSYAHKVAPGGKWIATVSTTVETKEPKKELLHGLKLLGRIDEIFYDIVDTFEPIDDGTEDKIYVTSSYDATSHFETTVADVKNIFQKITGQELDLTKKRTPEVDQDGNLVPTEQSA